MTDKENECQHCEFYIEIMRHRHKQRLCNDKLLSKQIFGWCYIRIQCGIHSCRLHYHINGSDSSTVDTTHGRFIYEIISIEANSPFGCKCVRVFHLVLLLEMVWFLWRLVGHRVVMGGGGASFQSPPNQTPLNKQRCQSDCRLSHNRVNDFDLTPSLFGYLSKCRQMPHGKVRQFLWFAMRSIITVFQRDIESLIITKAVVQSRSRSVVKIKSITMTWSPAP